MALQEQELAEQVQEGDANAKGYTRIFKINKWKEWVCVVRRKYTINDSIFRSFGFLTFCFFYAGGDVVGQAQEPRKSCQW